MSLAPAPMFPERTPQMYERVLGPEIPGQRGPQRFQEGIETDTDVPRDFALGYQQGVMAAPGRPNRNVKVDTKWPEETLAQRAHVGSASWIEAPSVLSEFAQGSFAGYGELKFEAVVNSGLRMQRPNAVRVG